jgi:hypothetical protein
MVFEPVISILQPVSRSHDIIAQSVLEDMVSVPDSLNREANRREASTGAGQANEVVV